MTIEEHPLQPFLPENATMLFLGSFPPPRSRWSMDFFYPNWINDFWRIMGLIFFADKTHFEVVGEKRFCRERIIDFAREHGLAFYDTARKVCREKDNASDKFLQILDPTDIGALLAEMPHCHRVVTTGGKASEELLVQLSKLAGEELPQPQVGSCVEMVLKADGRRLEWWRMPSSSRAYPLSIYKKAEEYRKLFDQ